MLGKTIQISPETHSHLRREAASLGVQIKVLAEWKLKKPLSKEEVNKLKNQ